MLLDMPNATRAMRSIHIYKLTPTWLQPHRPPRAPPHDPLVLRPVVPPHLTRVDVGATLVVGFGEHAHDADEDLLDALDRAPALRGALVHVRVVAGGVQDGDAHGAVGVDVWVEDVAG